MKLLRGLGALLAAGGLVFALAGTTSATGPGNNGLDPTGNGTKSDATVGSSLSAAGNSATMNQGAKMSCDGDSVGSVSGSFTLSKDLDVGSTIVVYLVPNNGSNANPAANVSKNETTVTLDSGHHTSGTTLSWSISISQAFTVSSGGILGVFAVNDDGSTAISSSKTNSLNCSEGQQSSSSSSSATTSFSSNQSGSSSSSSSTTTSSTTTSSSSSSASSSSTTSSSSSSTSFSSNQSGTTSSSSSGSHTLPQTATFGNTSGPKDGSWMLVAALGMILGSVLVLAPARVKTRR